MANSGRAFVALVAMFGLAGGCGEVAYKTGASADQLEQDRHACKEADGGGGSYQAGSYQDCMKAKGWAIASLDAATPAAAATAPADSAPNAAAPQASPLSPRTTEPLSPAEPPKADPMTAVRISGWAKFGIGSPDGAIADCVATLGPAHRPDPASHTVTSALVACMRTKGWQAL